MSARLIGSTLVLAAGFALGAQQCAVHRRHMDLLWELELALGLLQNELETSVRPMPQLCALLAERCGGEVGRFFRTLVDSFPSLGERRFGELWSSAVDALPAVRPEDRRCLKRLGGSLGRYELDRQLQDLTLCREQLRRSWKQERDALPMHRRLAYGLSLAGAALLLIVVL